MFLQCYSNKKPSANCSLSSFVSVLTRLFFSPPHTVAETSVYSTAHSSWTVQKNGENLLHFNGRLDPRGPEPSFFFFFLNISWNTRAIITHSGSLGECAPSACTRAETSSDNRSLFDWTKTFGKEGGGGKKEDRGRHADQSTRARVGKNRAVSHTYSRRKEEKSAEAERKRSGYGFESAGSHRQVKAHRLVVICF